MALVFAPIGSEVIITQLKVKDNVSKYLRSLGIIAGTKMKIVNQTNNGTIIKVKNTRYALDKNISRRIVVENI